MDTTTIAKTEKNIKDRVSKGLGLYLKGAVSRHGDAYVVAGTARSYTVFFLNDEPRCDCPDFSKVGRDSGHACKHGFAAVAFEARERCRPTARPKITRH